MKRTKPQGVKTIIPILALFLAGLQVQAQHLRTPISNDGSPRAYSTGDGQCSALQTTPLSQELDHRNAGPGWANKLTRIAPRAHGLPYVRAMKQQKLADKLASATSNKWPDRQSPKAVTPSVGANFEGNWSLVSTPPDNSMAVSNGGVIVTANNDEVLYMNSSGAIQQALNWSGFVNDPSLNSNIFDPKVIYDSQEDRFVLVVLHGISAATSKVLVYFSKTNNPMDGWWSYQLTGDPAQAGHWFDYPCLGVSNNEIYITGNLFNGNNQFTQAVIYQIQKSQGYNGGNLNWQYWSGLTGSPFPAFTLSPASWGQQGNYGPGILLVSNDPGQASAIRIWDLTNDIGGNPQLNSYTSSVAPYSVAADAQQMGSSDLLKNGDCRILSSFYLSGQLHYVHGHDVGSGWNGIRYNRTDISNLTTQQGVFGAPGVADVSYPALASFGTNDQDHDVMITFQASSSSLFPEVHVVNCDNSLQFSNSTVVKQGETFVNFQSQGNTERWGDYIGIARKHNENPPRVWLAAAYGADIPQGNLSNTWKTWVAEVGGSISADVVEQEAHSSSLQVYPNPVSDIYTLEFELKERAALRAELFDAKGALVKVLFDDTPKAGEYRITFNREALTAGTYSLTLKTNETIIAHETVVITK